MTRKRRLDIEITDSRHGTGFRDAARDVDAFGRKIDRGTSRWTSALTGFASTAAFGLAGVGVAGVAMGLSLVEAAEESQKVTRQTEAVLDSMGNVANLTAGDVAELAEQLSLKSGIDDELIQSGENVLLTFRNIRDEVGAGNDIFTRATTAALDMSVAMGTDMQSAVLQVGKALNDPIAGLQALTRVGVQFTDEQKAQIEAMVAAGDTMGAQKLILQELEAQFGGSAEAQATATDKIKTAMGNLAESVGEKLLPIVGALSTWIIETGIPALENLGNWIDQRVIPAISRMWSWVQAKILPVLSQWVGMFRDQVVPWITKTANTINERILPALKRLTGDTSGAKLMLAGLIAVFGNAFATFAIATVAIGAAVEAFARLADAISWVWTQVRRLRDALSGLDALLGPISQLGGIGGITTALAGPLAWLLGGAHGGIVGPKGIQSFAGGGISNSDSMIARVTPGEMMLNDAQQANLFRMIRQGRGGGAPTTVMMDMRGAIIASERQFQDMVADAWNKAARTAGRVNIIPSAVRR